MIVDVFTWGYEHDATIQRIRDAWTVEAFFNHRSDLLTAAVTTSHSRTSYMLVMVDVTWLKDDKLEEISNPADRQTIQVTASEASAVCR